MEPVLLIHGYSSEGEDNDMEEIYGSLPGDLGNWLGEDNVREINLSRWISLSDGVFLDDVSFAMDRALHEQAADLLGGGQGFHIIIHSTGALVVRNWIRLYSPRPCPVINLVHLAGANFGSGLAHIGRGQLARWGRFVMGTGRGVRVLNELELGAWKTIDMHCHFLEPEQDMYTDYQVQEFCIIGSQIPSLMRKIPIRYVKEDSSDNTVRTSACNLNFNYIPVRPTDGAYELSVDDVLELLDKRYEDEEIPNKYYTYDLYGLSSNRRAVPFVIAYETSHFGEEMSVVSGTENREEVMPLIKTALTTPYDEDAYAKVADEFRKHTDSTFKRAADLDDSIFEWDPQAQYEGHAQLVFRIRDQFGNPVEHFDVMINSRTDPEKKQTRLEKSIEDRHLNKKNKGTITYYFRLQDFKKTPKRKTWKNRLDKIAPVNIEITGDEPLSDEVRFLPLNMKLEPDEIRAIIEPFKTTIIDIELLRLPSRKVFETKKATSDNQAE